MQAPGPRAGFTELQKDAEAAFTPAAQVPLMQWQGTGASRGCLGGQEDVGKAGLDLGEDSAHLWHVHPQSAGVTAIKGDAGFCFRS